MSYKYPKSARLHHRTLVNRVFDKGHSLYEYPLRLVWTKLTADELRNAFRTAPTEISPLQMLVSIPKRKIKKAVGRVLMRRRIRETYRHLRPALLEKVEQHPEIATLSIAILYLSDKIYSSAEIDARLRVLLSKLEEKAL